MSLIHQLHSCHRPIRKLRLSILDACNFRCLYCMPEDFSFTQKSDHLDSDHLLSMTKKLVHLGIEEVRVTGGEPTLSPELLPVMRGLSKLQLKKIGLTTNALHLKKYLRELRETQCRHLNISLDSLQRKKFQYISKRDALEQVLESIFMAQELGFKIKINNVLMRGINDQEIDDFVSFSATYGIEVRFLELMNIGVVRSRFNELFMPASEVIAKLQLKGDIEAIKMPLDSTSFNFELESGAQIGFIASETKPFCENCSRLRLDIKGHLRPCLMGAESIDISQIPYDLYLEKINELLEKKPMTRVKETMSFMHHLGG